MSKEDIKSLLKTNLGISITNEAMEKLLENYIEIAQKNIEREGISLPFDAVMGFETEDAMLIMRYADYLYRKRAENIGMPRSLRYELNNKLFSQKAKAVE